MSRSLFAALLVASLLMLPAASVLAGPGDPSGAPEDHDAEDGNRTATQDHDAPEGGNGTGAPSNDTHEFGDADAGDSPHPCDKAANPTRCRAICDRDGNTGRCPHPKPACQERACDNGNPACPASDHCPPAATSEGYSGRFVQYELLPERDGIANFTIGSTRAVDELVLHGAEALGMRNTGEVLRLRSEETRIEVHDQPGGFIRFQSENASLLLRFPDSAMVREEDKGAIILYSDGERGLMRYDDAEWNGTAVVISGFASFHLANPESRRGDAHEKAEVQEAVENHKVAAEIKIARPESGQESQVTAYDEIAVEVQVPPTGDGAVRVELGSNLTEGRTVVLNLEPGLLSTAEPDRLVLRYFDVHDDGTETEVVFGRASDLADILNPSDDGGQPEYYIVSDAQGLQVMVSVPHWSVHAVTMSALTELAQPRVIVGVVAGIAGIALAAVTLFWPRRVD